MHKHSIILRRIHWEYINVLLMLLVSGTIIFNVKITFILLLLSTTLYYIKYQQNRLLQNNSSTLYFISNLLFIFLNIFIYNTDRTSNLIYIHLLFLVSSYLFITQIQFARFKTIFLNLVSWMALFNIIVYIGVEYFNLPTSITNTETRDYTTFLLNNMGVNGVLLHRLSGFYWEPGVFQIILNSTIILYLKEIKEFKLSRKEKKQFIIIITAIFLTYSTTAYIILILLAVLSFFKSNYLKKIRLIVYILLVVFSLFMLKADAISGKFQTDNVSYGNRATTNYALLLMIQQSPIKGLGEGTKQYDDYSLMYDNISSCNGILSQTASFGLIWLVIYLICLYKNLKTMQLGVSTLGIYMVIMIMQANEPYIIYPVTNIFMFNFLNNKTQNG